MKSKFPSLSPLLPYSQEGFFENFKTFCSDSKSLNVEIGFGLGEILCKNALDFPEKDFVGIEMHWERVFKTLKSFEESSDDKRIENVKIFYLDAWVVFERFFEQRSIDGIYCLFPCPWPKKSHVKYRLFSTMFLNLLNSRLKDDGTLRIVTDHKKYCDWICEEAESVDFTISVKEIDPQFDTKFERKWREEGQETFYELDFKKKKHYNLPRKEDVELKSYKLKEFEPRKFAFEDSHDGVSIVLKEYLYDDVAQRAVGYFIVAEEHLTQHLRVLFKKKGEEWIVTREQGQSFFPTPGINQAIKLVYESAKNSQV